MKQRNSFAPPDPMFWGGAGALIGGIAGVLASISGAMPETQSIGGLIAGGFFFPFAVVALKNWMAKR